MPFLQSFGQLIPENEHLLFHCLPRRDVMSMGLFCGSSFLSFPPLAQRPCFLASAPLLLHSFSNDAFGKCFCTSSLGGLNTAWYRKSGNQSHIQTKDRNQLHSQTKGRHPVVPHIANLAVNLQRLSLCKQNTNQRTIYPGKHCFLISSQGNSILSSGPESWVGSLGRLCRMHR